MELKVSAEKPGFSSSEGTSDPEDQEISEGEDEDDDRNHKHRRREAHSQSLEGNSIGQDYTIPYRKRNRTFHNGYSYRDDEPQSSEGYGFAPDRGFGSRLDKKHFNQGSLSGTPSDGSHRFRGNQPLRSEIGAVRGRGRDSFLWGTHDPRLGMADASPHIVPPGSISSTLFGGRTMAGISVQGPSWTSFGLIPGVPCGGLDSMHPLGLQGALGPAVNPQINLGLAKQRCRDFEERGFCLRGDMCPMEHGVNRIVIDDFQSLSQFNLPVSIPGSQLLGTSSVQGTFPALGSNPGALVKSKAFHVKGGKSGVSDEGVQGGSLPLSSDVYDPDQPLLTNGNTKSSSGLLNLNQGNVNGADTFTDADVSNQKSIDPSYVEFHNGLSLRNPTAPGFQNASIWGRQHSSGENGKRDAVGLLPGYLKQDGKGEEVLNTSLPDNAHQRLQLNTDANSLLDKETPINLQRKPSQKALRTLFVNGIPLKDNKKEALLTHFRKFGEVIDIYIPMNSERAFVQFSKTEEAELALKSPDAVMGNRFIKLWWANRDNISDDGKHGASNLNLTVPQRTIFNPSTSKSTALEKGSENHPIPPAHGNRRPPAVASKTPVQQQKLENLERMKEELRKKQQMLDQKRNEFKRQLTKLEKQTTLVPKDTVTDKSNKIQPAEHPPKAETPERENAAVNRTASSEQSAPPVPELLTPLRQVASPGASIKRFKLDNRPTSFKIGSPLPAGLTKIDALEEHFKSFGGFSSVELEEGDDGVSARVCFTSRKFAEKAFSEGTLWKGQKLQFVWLSAASVKSSGKEGSSGGGKSEQSIGESDNGPKSSPRKESQVC